MAHPPNHLGEFADEFADEDSAEFRQGRAAIPTRPEIDALFADDRAVPGDARAESIFGAQTQPLPRPKAARQEPPEHAYGTRRFSEIHEYIRTGRELLGELTPVVRRITARLRAVDLPRWSRGRAERERDTPPDRGKSGSRQAAADRVDHSLTSAGSAPAGAVGPGAAPPRRVPRAPNAAPRGRSRRGGEPRYASWPQVIAATAVLSTLAFLLVVKLGDRVWGGARATAGAPALVTVTTDPAGARVFIDGEEQGQTPARLAVRPGDHVLEVRTGEVSKTMPLSVAPGEELTRAFDLKMHLKPGRLDIRSSPAGAEVFLDGRHRGRAPLTLTDVTPGEHTVVVQRGTQSAEQVVPVEAGGTTSVSLTLAEAVAPTSGRSAGVLAVRAPVELDVYEGDRLLGTTRAGLIELPAGRRELVFANEEFGVRVERAVDVAGGKTTPVPLTIAPGVVTINALPWADVRLDGRLIGRTPIADLKVEPGRHDLVFRHPQHGRRRLTIMVSAGAPLVVTSDLTK